MGEEDNGPNLEELAQRMEALEQENRELRQALGGGDAPDRASEHCSGANNVWLYAYRDSESLALQHDPPHPNP